MIQAAIILVFAAYGFGRVATTVLVAVDAMIWRATFPKPVHPAALTLWQSIAICIDHGCLAKTLYAAVVTKNKAKYALKAVAGHILMQEEAGT